MRTLTIEQLALCIARITDAMKREGYKPSMFTVKFLVEKVCRDFEIERLMDLPQDKVGDLEMYLEQWKPAAALRFLMRDHKMVS